MSAITAPTSGTERPIGSERNRSKTPFSMSAFRFCPSATPAIAMVCAEQPGQQELQVVGLGPAGDRAAEDVGEQQQEDDRLQGDVDQRFRGPHDLDQAALGERRGRAGGSRRGRCGSSRPGARARRRVGPAGVVER